MGLNGIDVSSWQADLDVGALPGCDFVVVKATGGAGYTNESFVRHAETALAAGKLLGCYHYARELGVGWALEWLDRVREATGVAPRHLHEQGRALLV